MADFPHSQAPETDDLPLSENTTHAGPSYRGDPVLEQQHLIPDMTLASQAAAENSTVDLILLKDPMQISKPEGRKGDTLGVGLVAGGSVLLVSLTWIAILGNDPKSLGLFAYHPTLQTLAIALFAIGILTLQPTSNPKTKKAGLARHQLIILALAFPCVSVGALIIIGNKSIHGAPHFTTWHSTFGILSMAWMVMQIALGAGSVWFDGAAFGGGAKAKRVWKYHRLSGYMLFPFFLITAAIGGGFSQWMVENTSQVTRIFGYVIAPFAILIGLWSRARLSKMNFF